MYGSSCRTEGEDGGERVVEISPGPGLSGADNDGSVTWMVATLAASDTCSSEGRPGSTIGLLGESTETFTWSRETSGAKALTTCISVSQAPSWLSDTDEGGIDGQMDHLVKLK